MGEGDKTPALSMSQESLRDWSEESRSQRGRKPNLYVGLKFEIWASVTRLGVTLGCVWWMKT